MIQPLEKIDYVVEPADSSSAVASVKNLVGKILVDWTSTITVKIR